MIQNEHHSPAIFKGVKHLEMPLKEVNAITHEQVCQRAISKKDQYSEVKKKLVKTKFGVKTMKYHLL